MTNIINGKEISIKIKEEIKKQVEELLQNGGRAPGLAVVMLGDDQASKVYVGSKIRTCEALGIYSEGHLLEEKTSEDHLLKLIDNLNNNQKIDGILVQLPLPNHIREEKIIEAIAVDKDVDGFHPINLGKLVTGKAKFQSCTPAGIMELLDRYEIEVMGKDVVIIGRSNIVGKPLAIMMTNASATVTLCHSKTKDIKRYTEKADIVIVAVGVEKFLTADMIKKDCVVIDVGINRNSEGKLCGDVDFDNVSKKALLTTPVPGGVGPMTIAMLMKNTLKSRMNLK